MAEEQDVDEFLARGKKKKTAPTKEGPAPRARSKPQDHTPGDQTVFSPEAPGHAKLVDAWAMPTKNGEIPVTREEREEYLIALCNNVPFSWEMELPVFKIKVKIRAITPRETELVALSVRADVEEGLIPDDARMYLGRASYYAMFVQLLVLDGKDFALEIDKALPQAEQIGILRAAFKPKFESLEFSRWNALLRLLHRFESKRSICDSNIEDETFWTPAGTN